ncbi:MAG: AAA family ATPase [Nitrososphaerota archaeon]|nr:AAA family ATPase [Nitrososphaerota archaeon]MDG6973877.1 AAA family ATPase [Nitrososphaerota archaeon]MDG6975138.1 AAA family ATPase [Nitrososphaerota archaeon]MDG7009553.1 AAA family ATPase [Nitrososphaerota archaeon]MDG7019313.1 AAA family ATPase [Nitrososphaerota archaeon]
MAIRKFASSRYFSSGSPGLDKMLGGGYRTGTMTELFGRSNSGKSQLAMQAALQAAVRGDGVLYVDTEGGFRPERLEQIARARGWQMEGALQRVIFVRSDSAAEQVETVRRMQSRSSTAGCRLVVVDTLTRNFSLELPGKANLPSRQASLGVHLSEMARDAYLNERAYLLTNRVTFGPTMDIRIGGKTVAQLVHASVLLERQGTAVRATMLGSGRQAVLQMGAAGVI